MLGRRQSIRQTLLPNMEIYAISIIIIASALSVELLRIFRRVMRHRDEEEREAMKALSRGRSE